MTLMFFFVVENIFLLKIFYLVWQDPCQVDFTGEAIFQNYFCIRRKLFGLIVFFEKIDGLILFWLDGVVPTCGRGIRS